MIVLMHFQMKTVTITAKINAFKGIEKKIPAKLTTLLMSTVSRLS